MEGVATRAVLEARRDLLQWLLRGRHVVVAVFPRFLALSLAFRADRPSPLGSLRFVTSVTEGTALLQEATEPLLLLLSEHLADGPGLQLIRAATARSTQHRCLLVLTHNHGVLVRSALDAGAAAVVLEESLGRTGALVVAVEQVLLGRTFVDPALERAAAMGRPEECGELTPREIAVLRLVAEGLTNRQIGERLHIASSTARDHVQDILRRLDVNSRAAAAVEGVRRGYCR